MYNNILANWASSHEVSRCNAFTASISFLLVARKENDFNHFTSGQDKILKP